MTTTNNKNCPFEASSGYTTEEGRLHYLLQHGVDEKDAMTISKSLDANLDTSQPLYFWQLYSLIGHEPIIAIITDFYERVYGDDEEAWFRDAFSDLSDIDHHVKTQALYWIDAFGGGKLYHGGSYRLNFHHHGNASQVMNAAGAKRWMHHMRGALENQQHAFEDPRVMPCIVDFVKTKMKVYAKEHSWEFDECDFDFAKGWTLDETDAVLLQDEDSGKDNGSAPQ